MTYDPITEVINEDEIVRRRRELLLNARYSYAEMVALDAAGELDQEHQSVLRQVHSLDFLMSDDTDKHYAAVARLTALYNDAMLDGHIYGSPSDDLEMFLVALRDAIGEELLGRHTCAAKNADAAHQRTQEQ